MKFKVGDKVKYINPTVDHLYNCTGRVVCLDNIGRRCGVDFGKEGGTLHDLEGRLKANTGWWVFQGNLTLNKTLIYRKEGR